MSKKTFTCLNDLPFVDDVLKKKECFYKVELPVYILSVFRSSFWKKGSAGAIVFTDFTEVKDAAIQDHDTLPPSIPRTFFMNDNIHLPLKFLFNTSISNQQYKELTKRIKELNPFMEKYNFEEPDTANIESEGVIAHIVFSIKVKYQKLYGLFHSIEFMDQYNSKTLFIDKKELFLSFLERMKSFSSSKLFEKIVHRYRITENSLLKHEEDLNIFLNDEFSSHSSLEVSQDEGEPCELKLQNHFGKNFDLKHKRIKISDEDELMFQQHKPNEDSQKRILFFQSQNLSDLSNQELEIDQILSSEIQDNPKHKNSNKEEFLLNKITFLNLINLQYNLNNTEGKIFVVDAYVDGIFPYKPFIVKPYLRTLKVAPFKLVLSDINSSSITFLEFNTQKEICRFLKVLEVEELFFNLKIIENKLNELIDVRSKTIYKNINVKVCKKQIVNRLYYPYLTCLNNLYDLLDSTEHKI